jgi:hypothetical protein
MRSSTAVSLDDWILALHLLTAFALAGAEVAFTVAMLALRGTDTPSRALALAPVTRLGLIGVAIGVPGTIIFGIWLAISDDRYEIWNFWVIAAIVLWAIGSEAGRRSGDYLGAAFKRAGSLIEGGKDEPDAELARSLKSQQAHLLHWISVLAVVLVLVDMVWKPGA